MNDRWQHFDRGANEHRIHLDPETVAHMQAAASAGRMAGEMADHAQRTPVDLSDPHALRAHLFEAHGWDDSDLWRNSHDADAPVPEHPEGHDYQMGHGHLHRLHSHEHTTQYPDDFPNAVTMGKEHFHG